MNYIHDYLPEKKWPTYALAAGGVLIGFYAYSTWTYSFFKKRGIPYVKPTPLLGNMMDMARGGLQVWDEIYIKEHGKIFGTFLGKTPTLVVADIDLVKQVFVKDFDAFMNHPSNLRISNKVFDLILIRLRDERWRSVRHTLTPAFSSGKLKLMTEDINLCVRQMVEQLESHAQYGRSFDVQEFTSAFAMDTIAHVAFGMHINSQVDKNNDFVKHAKNFIRGSTTSPALMLAFLFPNLVNALDKLGIVHLFPMQPIDFFGAVVKQAVEKRQDSNQTSKDFLQLMLDAHNLPEEELEEKEEGQEKDKRSEGKRLKKRLTEDEVLAQGLLFFLAGFDTTATSLTFALYSLATNLEVQDRLRQDIQDVMKGRDHVTSDDLQTLPYLKQVLEESLRMYPIAMRLSRETGREVEIGGFNIPKGTQVHIPVWAIHYNPEFYPDPHRFDPDRFSAENKATRDPCTYLPFSMGPRNCIGMRLAMTTMQIALVKIVQKFKLHASEETQVPVELKLNMAKPKKPIKLKIVPAQAK